MTAWQIHGTKARFESPSIVAAVDLELPQTGIHQLSLRDGRCPELASARLLQITLPGASRPEVIHEQWMRGADLVAVYAAGSTRPSYPEVYWRSLTDGELQGWELIVSVHTGVLDDYPKIELDSQLNADELCWLPLLDGHFDSPRHVTKPAGRTTAGNADGMGITVFRLPGSLSYLEMVYPSDFCSVDLSWHDDVARVHTILFPERLEKGVIRRGRIRGWIVPTSSDMELAERLFREFRSSKLPLTT